MVKKVAVISTIVFMFILIFLNSIRYFRKTNNYTPLVTKLGRETTMIFAEQDSEDGENEKNPWPISEGTFIQWWLVKDWDDEKWINEFSILKEAGMDYIILTPTAIYETDIDSGEGKTSTIYPTSIEGFQMMQGNDGKYRDVVGTCLKNAEIMGIKVFLGLNFSEEWWSRRRDIDWIFSRMREGNAIADELWELYRDKYPNAFYGWYWCWEVDNGYFRNLDLTSSKKILANAIRIHLDHFDAVDRHLPFMLAPYMDWRLGTASGYGKMWEYVFQNSGMKEGDIFAPQDSIGAGGLNRKNYVKWFSEMKEAIDKSPGVEFWADIETFDIHDWTAITIKDIIEKMQELRPLVDKFITFSYSHYYSPNIVNKGFHETYVNYVKSGDIENIPPLAVENLRASIGANGDVFLNWNDNNDIDEICGYYVYRDGKLISNNQVNRTDVKNASRAAKSLSDKPADGNKFVVYEVQVYDFAGNVSKKSMPLKVLLD